MRPPTTSRNGLTRVLPVIAAVCAMAIAGLGLLLGRVSVPDGALGVLDSPFRDARFLAPGTHWRLPGLETTAILDPYRFEGDLEYSTPEGARLEMKLRVAVRLTPARAGDLLALGEGSSPRDRLDEAVKRVVIDLIRSRVGAGSLPRLDDELRASMARALGYYGSVEGPVSLEYAEDSPVTTALRAEETRKRIRESRRDTGARILIVGLDGADWQIAEPLIERGLLPNLRGLRDRGAWGNLKTLTPILSPLLWTSVATGVAADRHGVLDFLIRDPASGEMVPVNSRFRKVPALWNMLDEAGLTSNVVAWWATWPAEEIRGHMVSDRVAYSLFNFNLPTGGAGATWPPEYFDEIRPLLVGADQIRYEDIVPFVDITRNEFEAGLARAADGGRSAFRDPVDHLREILAATRSYHRIALDLIRRSPADLTAVYYEGIDEVGHRFMHFMPPRMEGIEPADVRRYGRAVEAFYVYQDRLLGELLNAAGDDTIVIVLSDHGFLNGADRPRGETADIEGKPGKWHRPYGILVLAGPPIVHRELDTTSLLDIAPTVLDLAGMPVPEDAAGRVLTEALRPEFVERFPESRIATYETLPLHSNVAARTEAVVRAEAEIVEKLRSLGYVGSGESPDDAPAEVEAVANGDSLTAHTNLAAVFLSRDDLDAAEREIRAALDMNPDFGVARRQMFSVRASQKRYDEALEIAAGLLAQPEDLDPRFLARVADTYRAAGQQDEGIRRFSDAVKAGRWPLGAPLARLLLERGDAEAADRAARAVLARDPRNEDAMVTVFRVAALRGDLASVRPLLEAALDLNPRSVMHLNWLAIVAESEGDVDRAEALLRRALDANPDHGGSMANLGALYSRHGREEEAVSVLERALRIDPENADARINLGSTLGRLGRFEEAIAEYERVVESGHRSTDVYNALARAHGRLGDIAAARSWLRRSLDLDPGQKKVRELLARLEGDRR